MKSFTSILAAFGLMAVAQAHYHQYSNATSGYMTGTMPHPGPTGGPPPPPPHGTGVSPPPAQSSGSPTVITSVSTVSSYVTICNGPSTFTEGTQTYTATASGETITITNCPCTISVTLTPTPSDVVSTITSTSIYCPEGTTIVTNGMTHTASSSAYVTVPVVTTSSVMVVPTPAGPVTLSGTPSSAAGTPAASGLPMTPTTSTPAIVTGNSANQQKIAVGALVAGGLALLL